MPESEETKRRRYLRRKHRRFLENPDATFVDCQEASEHLEWLLKQAESPHVGLKTLAMRAPEYISESSLRRIYYRQGQTTNRLARIVFGITPEDIALHNNKAITQALLRRLLSHEGVTISWISRNAGVGRNAIRDALHGNNKTVRTHVHKRIKELTDRFIEVKNDPRLQGGDRSATVAAVIDNEEKPMGKTTTTTVDGELFANLEWNAVLALRQVGYGKDRIARELDRPRDHVRAIVNSMETTVATAGR